jgi:hypothetical protein
MTNLPAVHETRPTVCGTALQPREARRSRRGRWITKMFNLDWVSAANTRQPASILSKDRTIFEMEVSSQSTHLSRAANATANMLRDARADETCPDAGCEVASRNTSPPAHRRLAGHWRERAPHIHRCASLMTTSSETST